MASEERKSLPSGLPLLAALVVICGAVWLNRRPLESPRPSPPAGTEPAVFEEGKVEAMLWQDPLQVALDHERDFHSGVAGTARPGLRQHAPDHALNQISRLITAAVETPAQGPGGNIKSQEPTLQILLVMVPDQASFEEQETRLRTRYAVLTALRASGMTPQDASHLQYFTVPNDLLTPARALVFPFERFKRREFDWQDSKDPLRPHQVLVIWLPDGAFEAAPLKHVATLLRAIDQESGGPDDLAVQIWRRESVCVDLIGPTSSTTLASMLDEITSPDEGRRIFPKPEGVAGERWLRIYSPWSTASPVLLLKNWWLRLQTEDAQSWPTGDASGGVDLRILRGNPDITDCSYRIMPHIFHAASIDFIRTIGSDDLLADEAIRELQRRGVRVKPRINRDGGVIGWGEEVVLISEWDRLYGRAFPRTLGIRMKGGDYRDEELPGNLRVYSYIKGIDGKLPKPQEGAGKSEQDKAGADSRWTYHANLELPIGCSQLDYARRIAQKLREEYRSTDRPRPKAIGVVGTDVYDKLILLHALREQFGNTLLLFTTDLDARLLHHQQLRWTRNLIVFSHFGLELGRTYRQGLYDTDNSSEDPAAFPPFRESYQTAVFLACRDALEHGREKREGQKPLHARSPQELADVLGQPRIFEVGRVGAVDLSVPPPPAQGESSAQVQLHPRPRPFLSLRDVPPESLRRLAVSVVGIGLVVTLCGSFCWQVGELVPRGRKTRRQTSRFKAWRKRYSGGFWPLTIVALFLFVILVLYDHYLKPDGEPFSLVAGMSIWPGLGLWLVAIVVAVYSILRSFEIVESSNLSLREDFGLTGALLSRRACRVDRPASFWRLTLVPACVEVIWREFDPNGGVIPGHKQAKVNVQTLWRWYLTAGSTRWRLTRSLLFTIMSLLIMVIPVVLLDWPFAPYRGITSHVAYGAFGFLLAGLLLFVLFLVVDAIILSLRLVGVFIKYGTRWPKTAARRWNSGRRLAETEELSGWLEIEFIASLTEAIGRLLYLPALVLLLVIAGRFPYFDNWSFPPFVVLVYVACALLIVVCTLGLRFAARYARDAVLSELTAKLRSARFGAPKDEALAVSLTHMAEDVRTTKRGAFQSLAESSVVHFLLIPSGGVGLLALLPYLLPS